MKPILVLLLFVLSLNICLGQHKETSYPQWRAVVMMANSHIPKAFEGGKQVYIIPTWGLDLDYRFQERWSLDLQTDIKLQSFEIEKEGIDLKRSFPFSVATIIHYYTPKHWSFFAGPGYELETHENIFLFKAGVEYGFEISENFEIGLNLIYENRNEVYDGVTFGVSFNFLLNKSNE